MTSPLDEPELLLLDGSMLPLDELELLLLDGSMLPLDELELLPLVEPELLLLDELVLPSNTALTFTSPVSNDSGITKVVLGDSTFSNSTSIQPKLQFFKLFSQRTKR